MIKRFRKYLRPIKNSCGKWTPSPSYCQIRHSKIANDFWSAQPRVREIDWAVKQQIPIEVFPNSVINVNSDRKLAQQIHFIINQQLSGIFHLGSKDLVVHFEFIKAIVERRNHKKASYKQVFTSNEIRYLATLPKENRLPAHLQIDYNEVLDDLDLIRKII